MGKPTEKAASKFVDSYKKKSSTVDPKVSRAHRRSLEQKEHRFRVGAERRNIASSESDLSPLKESPDESLYTENKEEKQRNPGKETATERAARLVKWREERDLKKKSDKVKAEAAKPRFKMTGASSTTLPTLTHFVPRQVAPLSLTQVAPKTKPSATAASAFGGLSKTKPSVALSTSSKTASKKHSFNSSSASSDTVYSSKLVTVPSTSSKNVLSAKSCASVAPRRGRSAAEPAPLPKTVSATTTKSRVPKSKGGAATTSAKTTQPSSISKSGLSKKKEEKTSNSRKMPANTKTVTSKSRAPTKTAKTQLNATATVTRREKEFVTTRDEPKPADDVSPEFVFGADNGGSSAFTFTALSPTSANEFLFPGGLPPLPSSTPEHRASTVAVFGSVAAHMARTPVCARSEDVDVAPVGMEDEEQFGSTDVRKELILEEEDSENVKPPDAVETRSETDACNTQQEVRTTQISATTVAEVTAAPETIEAKDSTFNVEENASDHLTTGNIVSEDVADSDQQRQSTTTMDVDLRENVQDSEVEECAAVDDIATDLSDDDVFGTAAIDTGSIVPASGGVGHSSDLTVQCSIGTPTVATQRKHCAALSADRGVAGGRLAAPCLSTSFVASSDMYKTPLASQSRRRVRSEVSRPVASPWSKVDLRNSFVLRGLSPDECVEVLKNSPMIEMTRRTPKARKSVSPMLNFDDVDEVLASYPPEVDTGPQKAGTQVFGDALPPTPNIAEPTLKEGDSTVGGLTPATDVPPASSDEGPTASAVRESNHDVPYFHELVSSETQRLEGLATKWEKVCADTADIPEAARGEIDSVVGQCRLLIVQRFKQFLGLVDNSEHGTGEKEITCTDLQGFWDMVYFQVEDMDVKFGKLDGLQARDWQVFAEGPSTKPKKMKKKVGTKAVASAKPAIKSKFAAFRAAQLARQQESAAVATEVSVASPAAAGEPEMKTFDAGFFKVSSPVNEPKPHCLAGSSPSLTPRHSARSNIRSSKRLSALDIASESPVLRGVLEKNARLSVSRASLSRFLTPSSADPYSPSDNTEVFDNSLPFGDNIFASASPSPATHDMSLFSPDSLGGTPVMPSPRQSRRRSSVVDRTPLGLSGLSLNQKEALVKSGRVEKPSGTPAPTRRSLRHSVHFALDESLLDDQTKPYPNTPYSRPRRRSTAGSDKENEAASATPGLATPTRARRSISGLSFTPLHGVPEDAETGTLDLVHFSPLEGDTPKLRTPRRSGRFASVS